MPSITASPTRFGPDTYPPGGFRVNRVAPTAPLRWLRAGWTDFVSMPGHSLLYGALLALGCLLVANLARQQPQLVFGFVTGLLLIGPFLAIGLYEASRRREAGEPASIGASIGRIRQRLFPIGLLAIVLGFVMIAWLRLSSLVVALKLGAIAPSVEAYTTRILYSADGVVALLLLFGLGCALAAAVFVTCVISLPMLLDHEIDPVSATLTSVNAVTSNPRPMLIWAGMIVGLNAVGIASVFVGMVVVFPVLGYASWHAYRELVACTPYQRSILPPN
ncbi:MAG: DUF2189 domain-containing protein [Thiotrichales bacterium]